MLLQNIPVKFFSKRIQGRNEGRTVELRTDASEKTWQVKIQGRRLTVGWKEFASAHDFRVGDIIVFRHEGSLVFHVTALGPSCCEIQYVPSCNNQENISKLSSVFTFPGNSHFVLKILTFFFL